MAWESGWASAHLRDPQGFDSRAMPLHKKITAIVVFAFCGFFGGYAGQAHAAYDGIANISVSQTTCGGYACLVVSQTGGTSYDFAYAQYLWNGNIAGAVVTSNGTINHGTPWAWSGDFFGYSYMSTHYGRYDMWLATSACNQDGGSDNGIATPNASSCHWTHFYVDWQGSGGSPTDAVIPPDPSVSRITSVSPSGTISSTSPLTITVSADIHAADVASSTANGGLLRIFSWVGGIDTAFQSPSHAFTVSAGGATTTTYQVNTDLPAGNFKIYASIYALDAYGAFGPTYSATTTFFTLNESYFQHLTGTTTPTNLAYKNAPCGITDVSGCIQNALAFLFYPTVSPGQAFTTVSSAAQGKFPFVYVYQLGAIRTSLLTASSTAPTGLTVNLWKLPNAATSTIELISETKVAAVPFSGTIYTVLTWLIWLGMAEYIYYRVIRMHDVNTPPT